MLRLVFLVIFFVAIPFHFFAGKLSIIGITRKCIDDEEVPEWLYYTICLIFLVSICYTAIMVDDLTLVFGFISGLVENMIVFVFPGMFYFSACRM